VRDVSQEGQFARQDRVGRREYARPSAPRDPFFDKPYEPAAAEQTSAPSWEASARPAARGVSANIKHKVKVAALFKAS
jgi:ATP-dependent RNA helicase RhlE